MYFLLDFLLMASKKGEGNSMMNIFFFGAIIFVFYFFMIRPQQKKSKDQKQFIGSLEKGAKIVTTGGIHGIIVKMDETTFTIQVEGGTNMKIERSAVSLENSRSFSAKK